MSEFEQQEQSIRLLDEHGKALAVEAREVMAADPAARVVGLILAPDAAEARGITDAIAQATGQDVAGRGFVGLVPREFALTILRSNAPATLDWLSSDDTLPLVCATRDGFRLGSVALRE